MQPLPPPPTTCTPINPPPALLQGSGQPPASDPELDLPRVAAAMRTFFARLSDPAMLPELPKLQARPQAPMHLALTLVACSATSLPGPLPEQPT